MGCRRSPGGAKALDQSLSPQPSAATAGKRGSDPQALDDAGGGVATDAHKTLVCFGDSLTEGTIGLPYIDMLRRSCPACG